jgi:hypothetical protein
MIGIKMDVTAGTMAFMIGLSNYMDQTTATTSVKNLIAQFSGSSKNGKLKFYLNYCGYNGSDKGVNPSGLKSLQQIDAVLLGTINTIFNIGYNGTVQTRKPTSGKSGTWIGNALYLNFDPSSKIGLTLRSEYISDNKMIYFATKNIFANTLSLNVKVGPLTIIPEIRLEKSQQQLLFKIKWQWQ